MEAKGMGSDVVMSDAPPATEAGEADGKVRA